MLSSHFPPFSNQSRFSIIWNPIENLFASADFNCINFMSCGKGRKLHSGIPPHKFDCRSQHTLYHHTENLFAPADYDIFPLGEMTNNLVKTFFYYFFFAELPTGVYNWCRLNWNNPTHPNTHTHTPNVDFAHKPYIVFFSRNPIEHRTHSKFRLRSLGTNLFLRG